MYQTDSLSFSLVLQVKVLLTIKESWNTFCFIWATAWQNQQNDLCAQQRLRSAQSDQSSLSAWRNIGPLTTYGAHSEDSDQTWQCYVSSLGAHVILLVLSCGGSFRSAMFDVVNARVWILQKLENVGVFISVICMQSYSLIYMLHMKEVHTCTKAYSLKLSAWLWLYIVIICRFRNLYRPFAWLGAVARSEASSLGMKRPRVRSLRPADSFVETWSWKHFYGHSPSSADSRRVVVSYWRKNVH